MDIKECRAEIDKINNEMLELFIKRMQISKLIGEFKAENGLPIFDSEREKQILDEMAKKAGAEFDEYSRAFFSNLMELSRKYQCEISNK